MPAVATQMLATQVDLAELGPQASALGMLPSGTIDRNLRRASGEVLAAYGKRFPRAPGQSFTLAKWGDFTIGLVIDIAVYRMLTTGPRGLNPSTPDGKLFADNYARAQEILAEIVDLTNASPRIDPDAVGLPDADDEGSLMSSEGGDLDEADAYARKPGLVSSLLAGLG